MRNISVLLVGCLMFGASGLAQERQLRGGGHLLGETAEQFYSEGKLEDVFRACQAGDWKTASRLLKNENPASKINAKDFCAVQAIAKQNARSGARVEYKGSGDVEAMRADTFTLDGGHLVKIDMVYTAPIARFEGYIRNPLENSSRACKKPMDRRQESTRASARCLRREIRGASSYLDGQERRNRHRRAARRERLDRNSRGNTC
jgi:hypothetical protein